MNLYQYHNKPEVLNNYTEAMDKIPYLFWDKFKDNPKKLKNRENAIATDVWYSYHYAKDTLKGRFPKGEDVIAASYWYSYNYAKEVLNGPFPKGEDAIATDYWYSYHYAKEVLNGPFPKGEDVIMNSEYAADYQRLKGKK